MYLPPTEMLPVSLTSTFNLNIICFWSDSESRVSIGGYMTGTGDRWEMTGDRWEMTGDWWLVYIAEFWESSDFRVSFDCLVTCQRWQVTDERGQVTRDTWHVTHDFCMQSFWSASQFRVSSGGQVRGERWQGRGDMWHVTSDMRQVTGDRWHLTCGSINSKNIFRVLGTKQQKTAIEKQN